MTALAAALLILLAVAVFALPRRGALICMVLGALYLPQNAAVEVATLTFFPTRLLSYLCFVRVLSRGEFSFARVTKMDWALIILYVFTTLVLLTRSEESSALRLAKMFDVFFGYFAFRALITTPEELRMFLRTFALCLIPYVAIVAWESATANNLFDLVGAHNASWFRGERPRCFGSFRHPSLLGSVGATFFPLFTMLMWERDTRLRGAVGAASCIAIVLFSNSGGPLSALATAVIGLCLWPLRHNLRAFRWSLVGLVLLAAMLMKAPVWYLIARVSGVTGGTGWHRSYLIDIAVQNIDHWWLMGMPLVETSHWFYHVIDSTGGADVTNQYIAFCLHGGILALGLFIFFIYRAYSAIGRSFAAVRADPTAGPGEERLLWGLGVMLTVHVSNWLGISYWDQFSTLWLMQAATVATMAQFWLENRDEKSSIVVGEASPQTPVLCGR